MFFIFIFPSIYGLAGATIYCSRKIKNILKNKVIYLEKRGNDINLFLYQYTESLNLNSYLESQKVQFDFLNKFDLKKLENENHNKSKEYFKIFLFFILFMIFVIIISFYVNDYYISQIEITQNSIGSFNYSKYQR